MFRNALKWNSLRSLNGPFRNARVAPAPILQGAPITSRAFAPNLSHTPKRHFASMFCFQCEQTENNVGCTTVGVCGKTPEVAWAQDLLVEQIKNICQYSHAAHAVGATVPHHVDKFVLQGLFATLTNVNFDIDRFKEYLKTGVKLEEEVKQIYISANNGADHLNLPVKVDLGKDIVEQGGKFGVEARKQRIGNEDIASLAELCTYGLKGMCAYAEHASQLGHEDPEINKFVHFAVSKVALAEKDPNLGELLGLALEIGKMNASVMQLLDAGHNTRFGQPEPTQVRTTPLKGQCILISGHDLADLEALLMQTEGTGINVFTHGEMLPAHGYPGLKKFAHLKGNIGGAWQLQNFDFSMFPGPIVVTTNCIIQPRKAYQDRIYTTNSVGYHGVKHITGRDFTQVIEQAKASEGYSEDDVEKTITVGFGHGAILGQAEAIVELVKKGQISHFFFIGGCDGSEGERNYFTKVAKATPKDSLILTAGCGKYRVNQLNLGTLGDTGIPRLLDMGQCNDSFGALKVALALADAFKTDVNSLPLSLAVSWFEQKAVAVLLTLLHYGVRDIRLGPSLPAFLTPNVVQVLVEKFNIKPTGEPKEDVRAMLAGH